jgi:hypothetical protein
MTDDLIERMARAIALQVGYMGFLDTMPPSDPGDDANEGWVEVNYRPFLGVAANALAAIPYDLATQVIVPKEPTEAIVEAGAKHWSNQHHFRRGKTIMDLG